MTGCCWAEAGYVPGAGCSPDSEWRWGQVGVPKPCCTWETGQAALAALLLGQGWPNGGVWEGVRLSKWLQGDGENILGCGWTRLKDPQCPTW